MLRRVFDPRSIAVVGASADPAKRGNLILRALSASGYDGAVYAVNPRGGRILEYDVIESVEALPEGVDLAVLCTPASAAPELVRRLGARGAGGALVLAVGYGESGAEGRALQEELLLASRETGVRIVGPNTSGLLNLHSGVNLVGAKGVRPGGLALVLQSGNVALSLMTEVTERSWDGISLYLGVGNAIDVGFADALDYLETDDRTHAVIAYVEGLPRARDFLASAARITRSKPVVVVKSGRTQGGARAALSHTGAVAGTYERFSAGLAQAGVVELERTDELLHVAETLGRQPPCPPELGLAILTDGGGQGTLAVDALEAAGATLAELSEATRSTLRALLGPAAAVSNPVDFAGSADGDPEVFGHALDALLSDDSVGAVLVIGLFGGYGVRFASSLTEGEVRAAEQIVRGAGRTGKAVVMHTMFASHRTRPLEILGAAGIPVVASLETACRCAVELQRRGRLLARKRWAGAEAAPARPGAGRRHPELDDAAAEERRTLSEPEARAVLERSGLRFDGAEIVGTAGEAAKAWSRLGCRAAAKLVSRRITHKSDAGGVVLDVDGPEEAAEAFERIARGAAAWRAAHDLPDEETRVLLTPMLHPPRAELLVGAAGEPALGPVVTVGAGGIWVEALADVAHRVLPVRDEEIVAALADLRVTALLGEARGLRPVDLAPVVAAVRAVATAIEEDARITEVEINPLFVYEDRSVPVDARVVLEPVDATP